MARVRCDKSRGWFSVSGTVSFVLGTLDIVMGTLDKALHIVLDTPHSFLDTPLFNRARCVQAWSGRSAAWHARQQRSQTLNPQL